MELSRNWKSQIVISKKQMMAGAERHRPFFLRRGEQMGLAACPRASFAWGAEYGAAASGRGTVWSGDSSARIGIGLIGPHSIGNQS